MAVIVLLLSFLFVYSFSFRVSFFLRVALKHLSDFLPMFDLSRETQYLIPDIFPTVQEFAIFLYTNEYFPCSYLFLWGFPVRLLAVHLANE